MKVYHVVELRKAMAELGNCAACGVKISKGNRYRHVHVSGAVVYFCDNCEVNQSLIGKNKSNNTNDSKVIEIKEVTEAPEAKESNAEQIENTGNVETTNILNKVYCNKCKGTHVIGSRRYRQHKDSLEVMELNI